MLTSADPTICYKQLDVLGWMSDMITNSIVRVFESFIWSLLLRILDYYVEDAKIFL